MTDDEHKAWTLIGKLLIWSTVIFFFGNSTWAPMLLIALVVRDAIIVSRNMILDWYQSADLRRALRASRR